MASVTICYLLQVTRPKGPGSLFHIPAVSAHMSEHGLCFSHWCSSGWRASDCDAPSQLLRIQISTGNTLLSSKWRVSPTWRKRKAFPFPGTVDLWVLKTPSLQWNNFCIHHGIIPSLVYLYLRLFPIFVRQLVESATAYQLLKTKLLCFPKIRDFFCPRWPGTKYPEGMYSHDEVRQPCLYSKGSEGVFVLKKQGSPCLFLRTRTVLCSSTWDVKELKSWCG